MQALERVASRFLARLDPPPRLDLAAWIEGNVSLPAGLTQSPGPVRLYPYQRGICGAVCDPDVRRVTVIKAARVGYTTLLTAIVGSFVANDPCAVLMVLPTDGDARDYVASELEPVFAESPVLRGRLSDDGSPKNRNTITSRRFSGGSLKVLGSAPRNLRRQSARVLIVDEATGMKADKKEGAVIDRAIVRTLGFDDRKIIEGSTLTDETSNVLLSYAQSNRARFELPCPECGGFTYLEWRHIEWEPGRPETAAFRCPHCEALVPETHKPAMVAAGRWIVRNPEVREHAGFHLNALVSLLRNAAWGRLAAEFLVVKDNPEQLQSFVNTILAEPWLGDVSDIDEAALAERVEPFGISPRASDGAPRSLPAEVVVAVVGTDVQDDRLECSVVGFSPDAAFVLEHLVIFGSPDEEATWRQHDDLLKSRWPHPHGGTLTVSACAVDSGDGDWSSTVCRYAFPRARQGVVAIKGMGGTRPPIQRSKTDSPGGRIWIVGVDNLKSAIMARLDRGGSIRFSDNLDAAYFEQLVSERKVIKTFAGQPRRVWERIPGRRAEALDCLVYALAVRQFFPAANLEQRAAALHQSGANPGTASPLAAQSQVRRRTIRSSYMGD